MAKENLMKAVQDSGWYLTPESVDEFLAEKPSLNASELIKKTLDSDLKNIGAKYLTESVSGGKAENFEAKGVLQLVKLRNIGAPKENEHSHTAPALYKLTLTDGHLNVNCLALDGINKLNLQTPPGTKVLLKGSIRIRSNLLLLNNQNTTVLGGHVDYLVVKWKANQELTNHVREKCMTEVPPPPWMPFGSRNKKVADQDIDTNKKALAEVEKKDEESSEFTQARQAALAEAMKAKLTITKTFTQKTVDRSAVAAAETTAKPDAAFSAPSRPMKGRRGRRFGKRDDDDDDYIDPRDKEAMAAAAAKPSALTLLDVFKTKIEIDAEEPPVAVSNPVVTERPAYTDRRQKYGRNNRQPYHQNNDNSGRNGNANANKQVYNPSDFDFELGDDTNVKHSVRLERELKSSSTVSNTASVPSSSSASQNQPKNNSYNNHQSQSARPERSNNYNQQNYQNRQDNYNQNSGPRIQQQYNNSQNNRNQGRQQQQPRRDHQQQSQFMNQNQYYPNDQQYYYDQQDYGYNQQYSQYSNQQASFYPQQEYYGGPNDAHNSNYQGAQQRSYKNNQGPGNNNNNKSGGRVYTNSSRRNH